MTDELRLKYASALARRGQVWLYLFFLLIAVMLLGFVLQVDSAKAFLDEYTVFALAPWAAAYWATQAAVKHRTTALLSSTDDRMLEVLYEEAERQKLVRQVVGGVALVAVAAGAAILWYRGDLPSLSTPTPAAARGGPAVRPINPNARTARSEDGFLPLMVRNECQMPVRVAVTYQDPTEMWRTESWWSFDPAEAATLHANGRQMEIPSRFFYYAESADQRLTWNGPAGNPVRTLGDRQLVFRTAGTRLENDRRVLTLTCNE